MGQYALEYYEKYKTHKIRPVISSRHPDNWGCKQFTPLHVSWQAIELKPGLFDISSVEKILLDVKNPLLILDLSPPPWAQEPLADLHKSFILKLGSMFDKGQFIGVWLAPHQFSAMIADTFQSAFKNTPIIIDLTDTQAQNYFKYRNQPFGIQVSCLPEEFLSYRELFARQNLQHIWKSSPVILQMPKTAYTSETYTQAQKWHVSFSNVLMDTGYRLELRKLAYPKEVSSRGALPLRFWFVNTGTAPCYQTIRLKVRLSCDSNVYDISLKTENMSWSIGDIIYNEIVPLPEITVGEYTLSLGLWIEEHALQIANQLEFHHDFYMLGKILVDEQNRDDLFHIWDTYYPEGYYPLEDPQAPNESEQNQTFGGDAE
ncbi:DUF4832 domain-containing protein [Scatolibacter rhodanostii]|uniref:DUF4832 domain-containing protein n=1 Tax=Scatolibacter rhodanostii TaxID=2014781 RepID=UPI000C07AE05|nr:DUF4832 domain-containing protein [Scatolibacter rhodanostii]